MRDARIGRILPASLHQAISETLPLRQEFYETWLGPMALRHGTISPGALTAVVSFLRREGAVYHQIMARAGSLAADWTFAMQGRWRQWWLRLWSTRMRARKALAFARAILADAYSPSRLEGNLRQHEGTLVVAASAFCDTRDSVAAPLCDFNAAVVRRMLEWLAVDAEVRTTTCRALGAESCQVHVSLRGRLSRDRLPVLGGEPA